MINKYAIFKYTQVPILRLTTDPLSTLHFYSSDKSQYTLNLKTNKYTHGKYYTYNIQNIY